MRGSSDRTILSPEKGKKLDNFRNEFDSAINDDLNTPKALAVLWSMISSNIPSSDKYDLAMSFDEVLGLKLSESANVSTKVPAEIEELVQKREMLRKEGNFVEADKIRDEILAKGHSVNDTSLE